LKGAGRLFPRSSPTASPPPPFKQKFYDDKMIAKAEFYAWFSDESLI
jgi:hypothetical protein